MPHQAVLAGELIRTRDAVRFFIDLQDGERPVKCEIVREGYLPPFQPGREVAGVTVLRNRVISHDQKVHEILLHSGR